MRQAYTLRSLVEVLLRDKLWDPTLRRIDALLDDEVLIDRSADALAHRHPQSRRDTAAVVTAPAGPQASLRLESRRDRSPTHPMRTEVHLPTDCAAPDPFGLPTEIESW